MPTFQIELDDGRKFEVDAVDQQSALAAFHPGVNNTKPLDRYHQRARDVINEQAAKGRDISGGYLDKYLKGATMGFGDELVAGMRTGLGAVIDPLRHIGDANYKSPSIAERYNYEKALEDERAKDADRKTGVFGKVVEIAGGLGTGVGAARNGLTLIREGQQLLPRVGYSALESAGYGAVSGAGEGNGFNDRVQKAIAGGASGAAIGAALPAAGAAIKTAVAPALSNITARVDPAGYARSLIARGLERSGMSADEVTQRLQQARSEGQGNYQLADVSPAFQRMTAGFMKAPGEAKTLGTEMLERRQANQGAELRSAVREGLNAPQTAEQLDVALRELRRNEANALYGIVDRQAQSVDVTPALAEADAFLRPSGNVFGPELGQTVRDDSIEAAVRRARGYLANGDDRVTNFQQALRAKQEIDNLIEAANPQIQMRLIPVRDALDAQLEQASSMYATARDTYRRRSQQINAITQGRNSANSGLPEDTIPAFSRLSPAEQSSFRVGYADSLMGSLGGPPGVNKARPLTADYVQQEINAIAEPGRSPRLFRTIDRSGQMNETRNLSNRGSATAENIADAQDATVDPRLFSQIAQGNLMGALSTLGTGATNAVTGNTEAVRNEALRILLGVNPATQPASSARQLLQRIGIATPNRAPVTDLRAMLAEIQAATRRRQRSEANALRGLLSVSGEQAGFMQ
jgi:hypothetical protein